MSNESLEDFDSDSTATTGATIRTDPETAEAAAEGILADARLQALSAVPVDIQVVLGHAALPVAQLLKLGRGAVVEIDRKVGEAVDIHINNHLVARGEVVILDNAKLGITLTDIVSGPTLTPQ